MEPPVRIELSKLSHLDVLQLVLPFIPGLVVTLGLMLANSPLANRFDTTLLGYKTKLIIAIAITYVIGSVMITLAGAVEAIINHIAKSHPPTSPWENTYWRRLAAAYVGPDLTPGTKALSLEDLDNLQKYLSSKSGTFDLTKTLTSHRKSTQTLEDGVNKLRLLIDTVTKSAQDSTNLKEELAQKTKLLTESSTILQKLKPSVDTLETHLREIGINQEWISLYHAMQFIPATLQYPYATFSVLARALQCAGLGCIWLMLQYHELWNLGGMLISVALVLTTAYGIFKIGQMSFFYGYHNSSQLAAMIQDLKQRSNKELSPSEGINNGIGKPPAGL
jgi:hypothetical protein